MLCIFLLNGETEQNWLAVYWDQRGQRDSSGEHFVLPSGWLLELLRARMRGCLTALASPGHEREQVGCSQGPEIGRSIHVQLNKQLEDERLPPARPWREKKREMEDEDCHVIMKANKAISCWRVCEVVFVFLGHTVASAFLKITAPLC